jgi:hypothetical protein
MQLRREGKRVFIRRRAMCGLSDAEAIFFATFAILPDVRGGMGV